MEGNFAEKIILEQMAIMRTQNETLQRALNAVELSRERESKDIIKIITIIIASVTIIFSVFFLTAYSAEQTISVENKAESEATADRR